MHQLRVQHPAGKRALPRSRLSDPPERPPGGRTHPGPPRSAPAGEWGEVDLISGLREKTAQICVITRLLLLVPTAARAQEHGNALQAVVQSGTRLVPPISRRGRSGRGRRVRTASARRRSCASGGGRGVREAWAPPPRLLPRRPRGWLPNTGPTEEGKRSAGRRGCGGPAHSQALGFPGVKQPVLRNPPRRPRHLYAAPPGALSETGAIFVLWGFDAS